MAVQVYTSMDKTVLELMIRESRSLYNKAQKEYKVKEYGAIIVTINNTLSTVTVIDYWTLDHILKVHPCAAIIFNNYNPTDEFCAIAFLENGEDYCMIMSEPVQAD